MQCIAFFLPSRLRDSSFLFLAVLGKVTLHVLQDLRGQWCAPGGTGGGDASFFSLMGLIKYEFNNSTVI